MSTRILSAYFDDVRKGKKDVDLIRQFLLDTYDREPVKRGHLLNWLDQAQYEHPIPVTDFLILRKEVEATLKNNGARPAADEATMIAAPAAPDALTLVSTAITTVATQATDATLAEEAATLITQMPDSTPLPERSDHAGLHNAATTIRPPPVDTLSLSAQPQAPGKSLAVSRRFLLWSALSLAVVAILGALALRYWLGQQTPRAHDPRPATAEVNHVLNSAPAGSIGTPAASEPAPARNDIDEIQVTLTPAPPALDLETLSEQELRQELHTRVEQGQLLPLTATESAYETLRVLERRFPASTELLPARISLKNAHLKLSDTAREQGQWELAQQHLDAAFDVLQQAAK